MPMGSRRAVLGNLSYKLHFNRKEREVNRVFFLHVSKDVIEALVCVDGDQKC